jgi:transcriptional regulator with XRE-family HTH domain
MFQDIPTDDKPKALWESRKDMTPIDKPLAAALGFTPDDLARFGERLAYARRTRRISQGKLAAALGWDTQSRISNYELGKREPGLDDILRMATILRVDPSWLLFDRAAPAEQLPKLPDRGDIKDRDGVSIPRYQGTLCPVLKTEQLDRFIEERDVVQVGEWLPCPVAHGSATVCLKVEGQANHHPEDRRSLTEGEIVYVDPDVAPQSGHMIVVNVDGAVLIRLLTIEGGRRRLAALNPRWPDGMIELRPVDRVYGTVIAKHQSLL